MLVKSNNQRNIVLLFVHPLDKCLNQSILNCITSSTLFGSQINVINLYGSNVNPIMTTTDREFYHDESYLPKDLECYMKLFKSCEALIIIFPTWLGGPPAIMKGFFEKLLKPGISFTITKRKKLKSLNTFSNIKYILAINTHGGSHINAILSGDFSRKFITRVLSWNIGTVAKVRYLGVYNVNNIDKSKVDKIFIKTRQEVLRMYQYLSLSVNKI